jgi:hypothetical protein
MKSNNFKEYLSEAMGSRTAFARREYMLKTQKAFDDKKAQDMTPEEKEIYKSLGKNVHLFDKALNLKYTPLNKKDAKVFNWIKAGAIKLSDYIILKDM